MKSRLPKVLHSAAGLPLIEYVLRTAGRISPASIVIVVGHQADARACGAAVHGPIFSLRSRNLSSARVMLCCRPKRRLRARPAPSSCCRETSRCSRAETLQRLVTHHVGTGAAATVLTAVAGDPTGYGRIERNGGRIVGIVEDKDASPTQRAIREINSGIYAFDIPPLFTALRQIGSANAQGEYYLPDLVRIYRDRGLGVETVTLDDPEEILGVNSRKELAQVAQSLRRIRNGRIDGRRRDDRRSGDGLHRAGRDDWPGHDHSSQRLPGGTHQHRRTLRDSVRRAHRRLDAGGWRVRQQLLRHQRLPHRALAPMSGRSRTCAPSRTSAKTRTSAHSWS